MSDNLCSLTPRSTVKLQVQLQICPQRNERHTAEHPWHEKGCLMQVALHLAIPGPVEQGTQLSNGRKLKYKLTGT